MDDLFKSLNAKPSISWLREQKENITDPQLIIDFFLNNDLHTTSDPVIDPESFLYEDYILESTILVQIDEIVDISLPLSKRKDFIVNNSEKKRTLKFLLSDGHFQFAAISKDYLSAFDPRIIPGVKMKILTGTRAKFGVLFLKSDMIEIIGGQSLELKKIRNSRVIYDENKYKNQQNINFENMNQNQKAQSKTKKRKNASLIITNEEENKIENESRLYNEPKHQTQLEQQINDNNSCENKSNQVRKRSFLDDDLSFNSDDIIENPKENPLSKNSTSNNLIIDQISYSSYSSDVEIINSIIEKPNKENLSINQSNSQQTIQKKKFLSDDDDFDEDIDFDYIENSNENSNNNKITNNDDYTEVTTSNARNDFHDFEKMKIWTINDVLKREKMLENGNDSTNPEIFLLDGKIVECNDLQIIHKKKSNFGSSNTNSCLYFTMNCKIACGESTMEMNVASKVIDNILESTPENWIKLDSDEQTRRYLNLSQQLLSFKSPLLILSTGPCGAKVTSHFFIVTNEFIKLIH